MNLHRKNVFKNRTYIIKEPTASVTEIRSVMQVLRWVSSIWYRPKIHNFATYFTDPAITSSIPFGIGAVPSRDSEINPSLDYPWSSHLCRLPDRFAFAWQKSKIFSIGIWNSQAHVVWLCSFGSVRISNPSLHDGRYSYRPSTLSMTFGRPCSIPESHIQLDLPSREIKMLSSSSESSGSSQLDGAFYTAAMWASRCDYFLSADNILASCMSYCIAF